MTLLLLFLVASATGSTENPSPFPNEQETPEIEVEVLKLPGNVDLQPNVLDPLRKRIRRRADEEEEEEEDEEKEGNRDKKGIYSFLYDRMLDQAKEKKKPPPPDVYKIPGPQEPLPGRSHNGDYWPVFPFQNQFSGGLDLDPSISRHIGGDFNLAVPSWGMLDIYGRFFNRIRDTTTKFGYLNYPVNMMDLDRQDFVKLMSDPSLHWNRNAQPRLPLGKLARSYVPLNCKPPMCNPYQMTFGLGIEHDYGGSDGVEGDIDVPIPISKGIAYRFPFSGKVYYALDNITVTYGQNLAPVDPMHSLFDYQYNRDPNLGIPRARRDVSFSHKVWKDEPNAKTFAEHLQTAGKKGAFSASVHLPQNVPDCPSGYLDYPQPHRLQGFIPYYYSNNLIFPQSMDLYDDPYVSSFPYYPQLSSRDDRQLLQVPYGTQFEYFDGGPRQLQPMSSGHSYGFSPLNDVQNPLSQYDQPISYVNYPFYPSNGFPQRNGFPEWYENAL